ncbi:hypothetical protein ACOTTU_01420 [Roseobacter sp. EG26]|uniref:hypothetical protein n=1 Tax=Roseobacter sp. EG26 TaxID=3412477 RepID=UPI0026268020|nr:hypothetical protein [uncultured Roseobacter sp.]
MLRYVSAFVFLLTASPVLAQDDKEVLCGHQADIVAAIAQARLDRVSERKLPQALAENATWPANYNGMIPVLAPHMYGLKRKELRNTDWRSATFEQCMGADLSSLQGN